MLELGTIHRGPGPGSAVAERPDEPPRRHGRIAVVIITLIVLVGGFVWAVNVEPLQPGSSSGGVWAERIELTYITPGGGGDDGRYFDVDHAHVIAPWVEGERITMRFSMLNESWVPIRLVEVFPDGVAGCGWQPDAVFGAGQMDPEMVPFEPTTLWPGQLLDIAVTGTLGCDYPHVSRDGLTSIGYATIRHRIAGIVPRTSDVYIGYLFSWTDSPIEELLEDSGLAWYGHNNPHSDRRVGTGTPAPFEDALHHGRPGSTGPSDLPQRPVKGGTRPKLR